MAVRKCRKLFLLVSALWLGSCSGVRQPNNCFGTACPSPTASVALSLAAKPLTPPPATSILAFSVTITGVTFTPQSGNDVNVPLAGTSFTAELSRLESDSAFLGKAMRAVPPDTYTKVTLTVGGSRVTYCSQPVPGTPGCANGSIASVSQGPMAVPISSAPFPLVLTADEIADVRLQVDLSKALTIAPATQAVTSLDLTKPSVFSAMSLPAPASSLAGNEVEFIEDVTGTVGSVDGSNSSMVITTADRGSISVSANSSTFYSPNCTNPPFNLSSDFKCVKANQFASVDLALNKDGTFTLIEYDPLAAVSADWIEGVITAAPSSSTQFEIVAQDVFLASSGSKVANAVNLGDRITVNLNPGVTFNVDSKGLVVPADAFTFQSANDTSELRAGQTVAVHVATFVAGSGTTPAVVATDTVLLRFTRVTGSLFSSFPPNNFFAATLPPFFGATAQQKVQLTQAAAPQTAPTNFDGVADANGLASGQVVSIRAIYFGPGSATPFSAAKVRKQ